MEIKICLDISRRERHTVSVLQLSLIHICLEDENVDINGLLTIDKQVWLEDVANIEEYFAQFGDLLPQEMADELAKLKANLSK